MRICNFLSGNYLGGYSMKIMTEDQVQGREGNKQVPDLKKKRKTLNVLLMQHTIPDLHAYKRSKYHAICYRKKEPTCRSAPPV